MIPKHDSAHRFLELPEILARVPNALGSSGVGRWVWRIVGFDGSGIRLADQTVREFHDVVGRPGGVASDRSALLRFADSVEDIWDLTLVAAPEGYPPDPDELVERRLGARPLMIVAFDSSTWEISFDPAAVDPRDVELLRVRLSV